MDEEDLNGGTAIHWASAEGKVAIVDFLLSREARLLNRGDKYAMSPLHYAATRGQKEVVRVLLQRGAKVCLFLYLGLG